MTFGQRLRQLRHSAEFTQRELAKAAGLDFSYISKVENDRNPPPAADTVVRLCKAMKIPAEALLALTAKLPSDVHETVSANEAAQEFLRETHRLRLTDDDWRHLSREARRIRSGSR